MTKYQDWEEIVQNFRQNSAKMADSDIYENEMRKLADKYAEMTKLAGNIKATRSVGAGTTSNRIMSTKSTEDPYERIRARYKRVFSEGDRVYVKFRDTKGTVDAKVETDQYCIELDDCRTILCSGDELVKLNTPRPTEPNAAFRHKKEREKD